MNILLVTVSYNNAFISELLVASVHGAAASAGVKVSLCIVNNSCDAEEVKRLDHLQGLFADKVRVIHSSRNTGYFGGLNVGIKYATDSGLHMDYDFVIVSNNDIVFPADFFHELVKNSPILREHFVVCPQIISSDGRYENPHVSRPLPRSRELLYSMYYSNFYVARIMSSLHSFVGDMFKRISLYENRNKLVPCSVYQGYGALYILSSRFLESNSELDYPGFLMFEEFFLSEQVARSGELPFFFPALRVFHLGKSSTGAVHVKSIYSYAQQSFKLYRKKVPLFGKVSSKAYLLAVSLSSNLL